jgi:hypothetical protein
MVNDSRIIITIQQYVPQVQGKYRWNNYSNISGSDGDDCKEDCLLACCNM